MQDISRHIIMSVNDKCFQMNLQGFHGKGGFPMVNVSHNCYNGRTLLSVFNLFFIHYHLGLVDRFLDFNGNKFYCKAEFLSNNGERFGVEPLVDRYEKTKLHAIYDDFENSAAPFKVEAACGKGCAFCCSDAGSIHITTLEGLVIRERIERLPRARRSIYDNGQMTLMCTRWCLGR